MRCSSLVLLGMAVASGAAAQEPVALDARLSPDGRSMAVRVVDAATPRLFLMPVGDSLAAATPLTPAGTAVDTYTWGPSGQYMVFTTTGSAHLYSVSTTAATSPRDLTPSLTGAARLVGIASDPAAAMIELPGRWPDAPDLYRVDLATGERMRVATNDGGIERWIVDDNGVARFAIRAGEEGETELARIRREDLVPVFVCAAGDACDVVGFHPDGRVWIRSSRDRGAPALLVFDPLTFEEEVVRADLSDDPAVAFRSDSLYQRDVGRLREQLGDAVLTYQPPSANGALMLVTARDSAGASLYLFDRWAGRSTQLFPLANAGTLSATETTLTPDATRLVEVRLRYRVTENDVTTPPLDSERRIERRSIGGRDVWRVVDAGEVPTYEDPVLDTVALLADPEFDPDIGDTAEPIGFVDAADTTVIDATTFRPIARSAGGPVTVRLDFGERRITGVVDAGGFETEVDQAINGPLWASGVALELLVAALPLDDGYTARLALYDTDRLDTVTVRLAVTGSERVRTPAGEFDTWRVTIVPVAGDTARREWFVRRDAPHYVVRAVLRADDLVRTTELTDAGSAR